MPTCTLLEYFVVLWLFVKKVFVLYSRSTFGGTCSDHARVPKKYPKIVPGAPNSSPEAPKSQPKSINKWWQMGSQRSNANIQKACNWTSSRTRLYYRMRTRLWCDWICRKRVSCYGNRLCPLRNFIPQFADTGRSKPAVWFSVSP